jgi:hypothetical protein
MLDLQLFAEETETETTTQPTEEVQEQPKEEQPEEIPEELDGLPEDAAREAMEELKQQEQPETHAEPDNSDNKPSEGSAAIPYPRFKEVVDKKNAMQAELEAYRAKFGELGSNPPQQTPPANQPPMPQQAPASGQTPPQAYGGMRITPEISAKIEEAVQQQALQMTGMTAEDAESLTEYGDEDNPQFKTLENAKAMARNYIMGEIAEAVRQQQAQQAAAARQQQDMVSDYNAFAQKEAAEPDFKEVQMFATNDYFNTLSEGEQNVLRGAYARVENQMAMPQDIVLVKRYFTDAKKAFRAQAGKQQAKPAPAKQAKPSLPRAAEVDGSASTPSQGITAETLAKMLDEVDDPSQLPENVQKMLMG